MAAPAWLGTASTIASAGTGIGAPILNAINAKNENKWSRQFAEQMYWESEKREEQKWHMQNEHDLRMWNLMNDYNSPMNQMARFKEAGLNPNLIYGQTNTTPAIATANFGKGQQGNYRGQIPDISGLHQIGASLMNYVQFREAAARTNNIEAQTDNVKQEIANKALQNVGLAFDNQKKGVESHYWEPLAKYSADAAELGLRKTTQEMELGLKDYELRAAQTSSSLREAAQRIMYMRGQQYNLGLDAVLKKMDIELKKEGVNPSDPSWMRVLIRIMTGESSLKKLLGPNEVLDLREKK